MAHEMEPSRGAAGTSAELEPYAGGVPEWYVPPVMLARPAWTDLHVPYREDSDAGRIYHHFILPIRALALAILWITHPDNLIPVLFSAIVILGVVLFLIIR